MKLIALAILTALSLTACVDDPRDLGSDPEQDALEHAADIDEAIATETSAVVIPHGGDLFATPTVISDPIDVSGSN